MIDDEQMRAVVVDRINHEKLWIKLCAGGGAALWIVTYFLLWLVMALVTFVMFGSDATSGWVTMLTILAMIGVAGKGWWQGRKANAFAVFSKEGVGAAAIKLGEQESAFSGMADSDPLLNRIAHNIGSILFIAPNTTLAAIRHYTLLQQLKDADAPSAVLLFNQLGERNDWTPVMEIASNLKALIDLNAMGMIWNNDINQQEHVKLAGDARNKYYLGAEGADAQDVSVSNSATGDEVAHLTLGSSTPKPTETIEVEMDGPQIPEGPSDPPAPGTASGDEDLDESWSI